MFANIEVAERKPLGEEIQLSNWLIKTLYTLLVVSLAFVPVTESEAQNNRVITHRQVLESREKPNIPLRKLYNKAPIMKKVAECESRDRQFNENGMVVVGKITPDIGRFQINPIHFEEAIEKDINVFTARGNAKMALILYNRNGLSPWYASKHCWS